MKLNSQPVTVLQGIHRKQRCETIVMHPSNQYLASGGSDSIIALWDFEELLCTGTISDSNNQVKNLDFSPCGEYLAAISYDEQDKKYYLDLYDPQKRVKVAMPFESHFIKQSLQWHPKQLQNPILALSGEHDNQQGVVHLLQLVVQDTGLQLEGQASAMSNP